MRFFKFPKAVVFLGLASLFTDVATEMVYPLFPFYLSNVLGAGVLFLGIFEGISESIASIAKLYSGYLSDRAKSEKNIVITGYTISSFFLPLLAIVTTPMQALFCRFANRLGKGIRTSARDSWLASTTSMNNRGKIFGFHRAMDHTGAFLGPLIASLFLYFFPGEYRILFGLTLIPGVLVIYFLYKAPANINHKISSTENFSLLRVLRKVRKLNPSLKQFLIILVIFTIGNSSDIFLLLKLKSVGVSEVFIPIIWAILNLVKLSFATYGGIFSDRYGRKKSILIGWCIFFLSYLAFAIVDNLYLAICIFLIYGLYYSFTEGAEKAFIADLAKSEERGIAYGAYYFTVGIGALPASVIIGFLWQTWGSIFAFSFGAALSGIALLLLFFIKPQKLTVNG